MVPAWCISNTLEADFFIERLWLSLKNKCVHLHAWETTSQAKALIGRWITFKNHCLSHTANAGQSPALVYLSETQTDLKV